jgi:hypothetical protein
VRCRARRLAQVAPLFGDNDGSARLLSEAPMSRERQEISSCGEIGKGYPQFRLLRGSGGMLGLLGPDPGDERLVDLSSDVALMGSVGSHQRVSIQNDLGRGPLCQDGAARW